MSKKNKSLKLFRKLHKWPGIIIAFLAVLFAFSGIVLNHRSVFSGVDLSRSLLPPGYQYENWNLAAIRGGISLNDSSNLIYGNVGIWELENNRLADFNQGLPKGIDHRKIYKLLEYKDDFVAATHLGLYKRESEGASWKKVKLPLEEERLADLFLKQDTLVVMSRHYLIKTTNLEDFEVVQLPAYAGYEREAGLFNTLWELHSGELFGLIGKLIVDLLGLVTILLSVTGLLHFFFPKIAKWRREKKKDNTRLTKTRRLNLRWHNVVGYVFVLFLLINTTAGIFLRPPLLIAIANTRVGIIPGTHLDSPNPWHDKLRKGVWDEDLGRYIFSSSDGFFTADESLNHLLSPMPLQPPVSVMGCNVLEPMGDARYLVGSFSGLFIWDIAQQRVLDAFTNQVPAAMSGRPISDHLVAGYFSPSENAHYLFEYDRGQFAFEKGITNWLMPKELLQKSPISLWNTALEIHTGRIFEHLIGSFYILYVPLSGLCLIMVLVSGFLIWWKAYRK